MKRGLTNEQIEWLKRVYAFTPNKEICEKLGRSLGNVHVWVSGTIRGAPRHLV